LVHLLGGFERTPNQNAFDAAIGLFEGAYGARDFGRSHEMTGTHAFEIAVERRLNADIGVTRTYALFLFAKNQFRIWVLPIILKDGLLRLAADWVVHLAIQSKGPCGSETPPNASSTRTT